MCFGILFQVTKPLISTAGNLPSDAHIAALALEQGFDICSTDNDFKRFPGIKHINPLA